MKSTLLSDFIQELRREVQFQKDGLASKSLQSLYEAGRIQGRIDGLAQSEQILEKLLTDETD